MNELSIDYRFAELLARVERCEVDQQELRSARFSVNDKQSALETQQITIDRLRSLGDLRTIDAIVARVVDLSHENSDLRQERNTLRRQLRDARKKRRR